MPVAAQAVPVNCDSGQTISAALAQGATLVKVSGTCTETVEILRDDVTIQGMGGATLNGGISINGARRILIKNLTIKNGAAASDVGMVDVFLDGGASATLDNVKVKKASVGVYATGSSFVEVRNGSLFDNNESGLWIDYASSGRVDGSQFQNSSDVGIFASRSSALKLTNNTVQNNFSGVAVSTNASIWMRDNTLANTAPDLFSTLELRSAGTVRLNGGNTIQGDVAIDMGQGSELVQKVGHDTVIGAVSISESDVARFEDVEIQGDVTITGRSTLKLLEIFSSASPNPMTRVTGGISVDQDSGLTFQFGGDHGIEVLGTISCADADSSIVGLDNVSYGDLDAGAGCTTSP
jgi:parallel beta-helix repeat protein